jgi:hypothetical protein
MLHKSLKYMLKYKIIFAELCIDMLCVWLTLS